MAKRTTITNQGLSLLASSSEATGQYYWLGYYALAYVPNLWKSETVSLPSDNCGNDNTGWVGSVSISDTDTDNVTASMTKLTEYGDMIYNIWQGDLNGTGYTKCMSDGSAGGNLFSLGYYNTNIKKHYRYVLDENGNNTLVGWIEDPTSTEGLMLGKHVFKGTDGFNSSTIPIPAPVYYLGDVTGKTSVDSFFDTLPTFENENGPTGNGADMYPTLVAHLKVSGDALNLPRVSVDYRGYTDSQGNAGSFDYGSTPSTPYVTPGGAYFNTLEIPYPISTGFDETSWFAADQTYFVASGTYLDATDGDSIYCEEFWKLHTISNFNRFHAPVDSVGHVLSSDLSNRNMAKTTKFFPIANYKVINTESGFTSNSQYVEVATGIKLTIDVDITPRTLNQGFSDTCDYNETSNIEFFNKYDNPNNPSGVVDEFGNNIYNSTHTSLKFNRIGIYAVPLRRDTCVLDQGFGTTSTGENVELSFQIDPNEEPILFAVVDWDNTIYLSDTGDGINQFRAEFDVNLQSPEGIEDTALIRNSTIFYNLYEDDALTWYQNQLIATASTQNSITEIGLEVAHIKNLAGKSACCTTPDLSDKYALKNHTHNFLRNLLDGNNKFDNGLKGIVTTKEGLTVGGEVYTLGKAAVTLGFNTAVSSDDATIAGGSGSYIIGSSVCSFIGAGFENKILLASEDAGIVAGRLNVLTTSTHSIIGGGYGNIMDQSSDSFIGAGDTNYIRTSNNSSISSGYQNYIDQSNLAVIGAGEYNQIIGASSFATVAGGSTNKVNASAYGSIINGFTNYINASLYALIGSGSENTVTGGTHSSIVNGYLNSIDTGTYAFIGSGELNVISTSHHAFMGSGYNNYILGDCGYVSLLGGYKNKINACDVAFIGGGATNTIDGSVGSVIAGGVAHTISDSSSESFIGAGTNNKISACIGASILGGNTNYIYGGATYSAILSGSNNTVDTSTMSAIITGLDNIINGVGESNTISGSTNLIHTSNYSGIIGSHNTISNSNNATALGTYTYISTDGEVAHSSGLIATGVTTKHSFIMMSGITTNDSDASKLVTLGIASSSTRPQLTAGQSFAGMVTITAYVKNILGTTDLDAVYHEIHSVSGIMSRNSNTSSSGMSYTEYDRSLGVPGNIVRNWEASTPLTVSSMTAVGTLATVIHTTTTLTAGTFIIVAGATPSQYNGVWKIITVVSDTQFTMQLDSAPSGAASPIGTVSTAAYTFGDSNYENHMPSIVDTVIDYRYTSSSQIASCQITPPSIQSMDAAKYPTLSFSVDSSGYINIEVDATEMYKSYSGYTVTTEPIHWSATCDFTWIDVN